MSTAPAQAPSPVPRAHTNPSNKKQYYEKKDRQHAAFVEGAPNGDHAGSRGGGRGRGGRGSGDLRNSQQGSDHNDGQSGTNQASGEQPLRDQRKFEDNKRGRNNKPRDNKPNGHHAQQGHSPADANAHVDKQKLEESARIQQLLTHEISPQHKELIRQVRDVVDGYSEQDILSALNEYSFDVSRTIHSLVDHRTTNVNMWTDVVKKGKPEAPAPEAKQQRARKPADHEGPNAADPRVHQQQQQQQQQHLHQQQQHQHQQHMQQQHQLQHQQQLQQQQNLQQQQHHQQHQQRTGPHNFNHQRYLQDQQQQQLAHQHQLHQQQLQQQMYAQQQQHQHETGDEIVHDLSLSIQSQLEELNAKSQMLLQMKDQLESIHATGKEQFNSLVSERTELIKKIAHLKTELKNTEDRLGVVEVHISQTETDKKKKLEELKKAFAPQQLANLITNGQ